MIRNIRALNRLVEPIHARRVDGDLLVFDGWQRVKACQKIGINVATLVYDNLSTTNALAKSLNLHTSAWNNTVSDNDRERAMMGLVTGERRSIKPWETNTGKIHEARYRLGLDSEEDKLNQEIGSVDGIGPATIARLIAEFGDTQSVLDASKPELQDATGIGPSTASAIRNHLDYDAPETINHVK